MVNKDKIAIVILNWNGKEDIIECLGSVSQLSAISYQLSVVVVDNGSTDGSVEAIKKMINDQWSMINRGRNQPSTISHQPLAIKLIENKENLGFAEGNNVGIRVALKNGGDFVLLLNNDTLVDKNLVESLLQATRENPEAGVLGPKIYFAKGFEFHKDRYKERDLGRVIWYAGGIIDWQNVLGVHRGVDEVDHGQYDKICETDFVSGCAMFVRRTVFEKIGLLDKRYFAYYEDTDFCERAKRAGFGLLFAPQAFLWHKVAKSSAIGSSLQDYYITRNRLLFGIRYARPRAKVALMRESLRTLLGQNYWRKRGVIDFYLRRLGKGSYRLMANG